MLDAVGFDERARDSSFVVTGEGRLDAQSLEGKVCGEVAVRCRRLGVPCHAVVGQNALERSEARNVELAGVTETTTLEELEAAGRGLVSPE